MIVVDSGPLLAVADRSDQDHDRCIAAFADLREPLLIPTSVLGEVGYMVQRALGTAGEARFLRSLDNGASGRGSVRHGARGLAGPRRHHRVVLVVSAPRVVTPGGLQAPGAVAVEDGTIAGTAEGTGYAGRPADVALPDGVLAPGLVDLQVNGCFGVDLVAADRRGWERVVRLLPRTGVTAFLPTFVTAPVPVLTGALRRTAALLP